MMRLVACAAALGFVIQGCGSSGATNVPSGSDGGATTSGVPGGPALRWIAYQAKHEDQSEAIELVRLGEAGASPIRLDGKGPTDSFAHPAGTHLFYDANDQDGRTDTFVVDLRSASPQPVKLALPMRARLDAIYWREGTSQVLLHQTWQSSSGQPTVERSLSLVSTDALGAPAIHLGDRDGCAFTRDGKRAACGRDDFSVIDLAVTPPTERSFAPSGGITPKGVPTLVGDGADVVFTGHTGISGPLEVYRATLGSDAAPSPLTKQAYSPESLAASRDGTRLVFGFQRLFGLALDGPVPIEATLITDGVGGTAFFGDTKRLVWARPPSGGHVRFETVDLGGPPPWTPTLLLDATVDAEGSTAAPLRVGLRELVLVKGALFLIDATGAPTVTPIANGVFSAQWVGGSVVYTTGNVGTTEVRAFSPGDRAKRALSGGVTGVKPGAVFATTETSSVGFVATDASGRDAVYVVDIANGAPLRVSSDALHDVRGTPLR